MQRLRTQRVRELLKRELGEVVRRELPLHEVGLITVNEVDVAADLKNATVYVGVVGSTDQQQRALDRLDAERIHLQNLVARAVVLKYTPRLRFVLDRSVERGNRVLDILADLEKTPPADAG